MNPASGRIHMPGSILAQLTQGEDLADGIREDNIRYQKTAGRGRQNILFIIDTSGSMLSEDRLAYVKGCVISLLESSYAKRVRVGIISFGGTSARLELPFTSSAELAAERISSLKGGSATPMVQAFAIAANLLDRMRDEDLSVYILSDGRYDRTTTGREDRQVREFGEFLKSRDIPVTLIDAGTGRKTAKRRAVQLAAVLHASYQPMEGLRIDLDSSPARET